LDRREKLSVLKEKKLGSEIDIKFAEFKK